MSKYYAELEDVIQRLDNAIYCANRGEFDSYLEAMKRLRIAYAETMPTIEVSEDCISREYLEEQLQLIEDITAMAHIDLGEDPYDETEEITMPISTVRKIFKKAPSVTTEQSSKVGEWIKQGISPYEGIQRCSLCDEIYNITEEFNYCPNCGAKMKG